MSAFDQNSNMPFLRNEFSKIFEELFTITLFSKMKIIYDQTKINMFARKLLKLNGTPESLPTAWGLRSLKISKFWILMVASFEI